jgi:hypothetical protein
LRFTKRKLSLTCGKRTHAGSRVVVRRPRISTYREEPWTAMKSIEGISRESAGKNNTKGGFA